MGMMTLPYDPAEDLNDRSAQEELFEEAFGSGDANFIVAAISAVARARGMVTTVGVASLGILDDRESGGAQLSTLLAAVSALGYKLTLTQA